MKSPTRKSIVTRILATFGWNEDNQLGVPQGIVEQHRPLRIKKLDELKCCAAGGQHMAAINKQGKLLTWGCNDEGGLGRVTKDGSDTTDNQVELERDPTPVMNDVAFVYAGGGYTLSMNRDCSQLLMHGCFRSYEGNKIREKNFGDSAKDVRCDAVPVNFDGKKLRKVACGENFCAVIDESGQLYTFGITDDVCGKEFDPPIVSVF